MSLTENETEAPFVSAFTFNTLRYTPRSGWLGHGPFALWLTEAMRPKCVVELGTHRAFSFFAFCQALQDLGLDGKVHAVDTWRGDEHAGFYGEEIFSEVTRRLELEYPNIGVMHRTTFDQAVSEFRDRSIDILHIDGLHTYEAARNDFDRWVSKVRSGGVVLFHDTYERREGFEVWKLWEELIPDYPHFEFHHGHGLGVIGIGSDFAPALGKLFETASDTQRLHQIRREFSALGESYIAKQKADLLAHKLERVKSSLSWKITGPLRKTDAKLRAKKPLT